MLLLVVFACVAVRRGVGDVGVNSAYMLVIWLSMVVVSLFVLSRC